MPNKYRAKKVTVDGIKFDSKREAARYGELLLLEKAGKIRELKVHPTYKLENANGAIKFKSGRVAKYTPDFSYFEPGRGVVVEDVKGVMTQAANLRIAVFEHMRKLKVEIIK